jgi:hypothetical protein
MAPERSSCIATHIEFKPFVIHTTVGREFIKGFETILKNQGIYCLYLEKRARETEIKNLHFP